MFQTKSQADYPLLPSKPILTSVSDMVTSDADENSEGGAWSQRTKSHRKRARQGSAPLQHDRSYAVAASRAAPPSVTTARSVNPKMKSIFGDSSHSSLRAAKTLVVPKAVYCLGNIDGTYTVEAVQDYISTLGVRVLSCFELKNSVRRPKDNKTFRVCIISEDKQKFLAPSSWSLGVSLREWRHKPKQTGVPVNVNPTGSAAGLISGDAAGDTVSDNVMTENAQTSCGVTTIESGLSQFVHTIRMDGHADAAVSH